MTRTLTLKQLIVAVACEDQVELFKRLFGDSVEVTVERAVSVADRFDWDWAAGRLLSPAARKAFNEAEAAARKEYNEVVVPAWWAYREAKAAAFAEAYIADGGKDNG